MSRIIFILICLVTISSAQDYKIVKYSKNKTMLVGISTRQAYQDSNFSGWFNAEYTNYEMDIELLLANRNKLDNKLIKIVIGTWCSDSRREVPRFVKILDFVSFPKDKVFFLNVDRSKKGIGKEVDNLDIDFVPTFIVYEDGEEIGRIIETPLKTLEEDLIEIISSN